MNQLRSLGKLCIIIETLKMCSVVQKKLKIIVKVNNIKLFDSTKEYLQMG